MGLHILVFMAQSRKGVPSVSTAAATLLYKDYFLQNKNNG